MRKIFVDFEMHPIDRKFQEQRMISSNEIIEFGAVMIDGKDAEISSFRKYVKPDFMVTYAKYIARLTRIKESDLKNAESFRDVLTEFVSWCEAEGQDYTVYAWSENDLAQLMMDIQLKKAVMNASIEYLLGNWIDFQESYNKLFGFSRLQSLDSAVELTGIAKDGYSHDALYDARNTAALFRFTEDPDAQRTTIKAIQDVMHPQELTGPSFGELFDFSKMTAGLQLA